MLRERGHRIVFVVDESFAGVLEARGFEERLFRTAPPEESRDPSADPWSEFIRVTAPEFRKPTIEQIATVTKPIWETLVAAEQYSHERVMAIWDDVRPGRGRDRQRHRLPGGRAGRRALGARRLLQPARDARPRPAAAALRAARRPTAASGRRSATSTTASHEDLLAEHNEFRASVGVAPCPPDEFNTSLARG